MILRLKDERRAFVVQRLLSQNNAATVPDFGDCPIQLIE